MIKYLTGASALNVPFEGVTHDWHGISFLKNNSFLINGVNFDGAEEILGTEGLFDCTVFFKDNGYDVENVLCANPIRVICDVLYSSIVLRDTIPEYFNLNEYMLEDIDKTILSSTISKIEKTVNNHKKNLFTRWRTKNELL